MKQFDLEKELSKCIENSIQEVENDKWYSDAFVEEVKKSIKHPHFQYAVIDTENKKITYERKKWYKWFSGKRVIAYKIIPVFIDTPETYYYTESLIND